MPIPGFASNWGDQPTNARASGRTVKIDILEPPEDTFVPEFGTLHIVTRAQAVWEHEDDPTRLVSVPGFRGITEVKMAIHRPGFYWNGSAWAFSTMPLYFNPADFGAWRWVSGIDGGRAIEHELSFPANQMGAGPLTLMVNASGHPRNGNPNRPAVSEAAGRVIVIDGTPPETEGRVWNLTHPLVGGRVTDSGAGPRAGPRRVKLVVRDTHTGMLWNDARKEWSSSWQNFYVDTDQDGNWNWTFLEADSIGGGRYEVTVRGEDAAVGTRNGFGNVDPTPLELFVEVSDRPPNVSVQSPTQDQQVGSSATFRGEVNDDRAVDRVRVTVRDVHTNLYWDYDSQNWSNWPGPAQAEAELKELARSNSAGWSYSWTWEFVEPPTGSGLYEFRVIAYDTTGDGTGIDGIRIRGENDLIPPSVSILQPPIGTVLTGSPFGSNSVISGVAIDAASGVQAVMLSVLDTGNSLWWSPSGSWMSTRQQWPAEIILDAGENDVQWQSYQFDPDVLGVPGTGSYRVLAIPLDVSGNQGQEVANDFEITHPSV